MEINELTPVEFHESKGVWLKRDDLFEIYNARGGKARSAYQIITKLLSDGYAEIVTVGARTSPQCEVVSFICEALKVKCTIFMPRGKETSVIRNIENNPCTTIERCKVGYTNYIISQSREYAKKVNAGYIPFGMECDENIKITSEQVQNIPKECNRIVVPVGGGMSFSSIMVGMNKYNIDKPLLGIAMGRNPTKTIEKYTNELTFPKYEIVYSPYEYDKMIKANIDDVNLDPIYEAKCCEFLQQGDLLWIVGHRH